MMVSRHFIVSLILAIVLFPVFKWLSLLVFVFGLLIDVDHYFWYVIKFRDLSLMNAYYYALDKDRSDNDVLHIFHVVEVWILVFILGFFNDVFFLLAVGLGVHLLMDFIHAIRYSMYNGRTYSLFTWMFRN